MSALAKQEPTELQVREQAAASETAAVLSMIERASRDPAVDIDKMERLMLMHERVQERRAREDYARDFAEMVPHLPSIDRKGAVTVYSKADRDYAAKNNGEYPPNARPIQKTPYATLDDILGAINPVLSQYGFSIKFEHETVPVSDSYRIKTKAILMHRGGHRETADTPPLMQDSSGSKNNVQSVGSSMKYGRRYALMAVLPIVSHAPADADDDGKAAGADPSISDEQVVGLQRLIVEVDADIPRFLRHLKIERLEDLPASRIGEAVSALESKRARRSV